MGSSNESSSFSEISTGEDRCKEFDPENGLILLEHYIPEEVLGHILSFVDAESLLMCRLVCKKWREIIENCTFKWQAERLGYIKPKVNPTSILKLNWIDYYWLIHKKPMERNLLKNNCGQSGLKDWNIITNGGDGWLIEPFPQGAEGLPPVNSRGEPHPDFNGLSSCFVTSFSSCSKAQLIDLVKNGLTQNFLDTVQPPIEISEWVACRFDCGCVYELKVSILDEHKKSVLLYRAKESFTHLPRQIWHQVTHIFKNYGSGIRYIKFYHGGMDSQYWKGHYGSKMSGGSVKILANNSSNNFSWME